MLAHLHIGLSKTGTSCIQTFLFKNRDLLKERQNCLYPTSVIDPIRGDPNHNPLTFLPYARTAPLLQAELNACYPPPSRLILSAEHFAHNLVSYARVQDLIDFLNKQLGIKQIRIIAYLRDIASHLQSECSQRLKNGSGQPFEYHHCNDRVAFALFDIRAILGRWIAVCGRENIRVRLFEPQSFVTGDLLHDAADALDLKWDEDFVIPPRQNERLNLLEMEVLRALNQLAPYAIYARNTLKSYLWQHISRHTSALDDPALRFAVPRATLEAYLDCFADSEEWVRREFFPERPHLFHCPDLSAYEENPVLRDPRPGHWQAIARTLIDLGAENARLRAQLRKARNPVQLDTHRDK